MKDGVGQDKQLESVGIGTCVRLKADTPHPASPEGNVAHNGREVATADAGVHGPASLLTDSMTHVEFG